jgi:hypothetical protein
MGTTVSTTKQSELNQIILDAMIENNMACEQKLEQNQQLCLAGTTIGLYQSQSGYMYATCEMTTDTIGKVQTQVVQKVMQQAQSDSKMLAPSTSVSNSENDITNIVKLNLTAENLAEINNNLYQNQLLTTCNDGDAITIGVIQSQSADVQLQAVSDVMLKTSIYNDLYGSTQNSAASSATFLSFSMLFILIIGFCVVAYFVTKMATDPGVQQVVMKSAIVAA